MNRWISHWETNERHISCVNQHRERALRWVFVFNWFRRKYDQKSSESSRVQSITFYLLSSAFHFLHICGLRWLCQHSRWACQGTLIFPESSGQMQVPRVHSTWEHHLFPVTLCLHPLSLPHNHSEPACMSVPVASSAAQGAEVNTVTKEIIINRGVPHRHTVVFLFPYICTYQIHSK